VGTAKDIVFKKTKTHLLNKLSNLQKAILEKVNAYHTTLMENNEKQNKLNDFIKKNISIKNINE